MTRCFPLPALLAFTALAGCQGAPQSTATAKTNAQAKAGRDAFTDTVTEAMCGTPSQRAHAIGGIASSPEFSAQPDDVYEVASDLAEKGCPKATR